MDYWYYCTLRSLTSYSYDLTLPLFSFPSISLVFAVPPKHNWSLFSTFTSVSFACVQCCWVAGNERVDALGKLAVSSVTDTVTIRSPTSGECQNQLSESYEPATFFWYYPPS